MSMKSFIIGGMVVAAALWQGPALAAEPGSAPSPLKVLVIRGLWHEQCRLEEGLALAGAGLVEDAWVWDGAGSGWPGPGDQGGGGLMDFPDAAGLAGYDVVVAANVNAKSFGKSAEVLADYVRNGGALFLLGGRFGFGKLYRDSALAAIVPVEFPGLKKWGSDLNESTAGFELKPGPDTLGAGFGNLAWDRKPLLFWMHDVVPKSGTKVLLTAGGKPALATGESGKGRVAVFAGTVMGDPAEGQTAFWAWDGWPVIEAAVLQWLGEARRGAVAAAVSDSTLKIVEAALGKMDADKLMEAANLGDEEAKLDPALEQALADEARRCRSAVQAAYLVKSVNRIPSDISVSLAETLMSAVLPYAGAAEEKAARELIKSGHPYKTALGLALLGRSKAVDAAALLGRFYETGKPQEAAAKKDDIGEGLMEAPGATGNKPVLPEDAKDMATAIRQGALLGLGHVGDAAALAILRKAMDALRGAGAPKPKEYADVLTRDNRLYQQAVMSALRCGDETAAKPMVETLMENIYIVARARNESNKSKDILARVQSQVGAALVWQREMYRQLAQVPDTVRPALAACLAAEKDRRVIYPAYAVFGGRPALPEASALLKKSPVPAVAALGR
jgi:uncharacterized membrane protein